MTYEINWNKNRVEKTREMGDSLIGLWLTSHNCLFGVILKPRFIVGMHT